MATGAPGTNGVWQYGEDDSEATFSALLNKAASTTDTQIGLDRGRLTTLEARKLSALVPVIPSSVNVSAGSGSYNSTTGVVTFTGAPTTTVNGVFTSAFANYRVLIYDLSSNATGQAVKFRLSNSGTASTGLYYQNGWAQASNLATGAYYLSNSTWFDMYPPPNGVTYGSISADLFGPQLIQRTSGNFVALGYNSAVGGAGGVLLHDAASTYDGISITTNTSSTFTGKMKIFGYN